MNFRGLQAATGIAGPKLAQQAGPVGTGIGTEPMADARDDWQAEQEREKKQSAGYKKGGSVKGWGKARGARKAKVY